jgi:hypothetical protein
MDYICNNCGRENESIELDNYKHFGVCNECYQVVDVFVNEDGEVDTEIS